MGEKGDFHLRLEDVFFEGNMNKIFAIKQKLKGFTALKEFLK